MTTWRLVVREILHRKASFVIGFVSVAVAVGSLVGALNLLRAHDVRTRQIIAARERELQLQVKSLNRDIRQSMLKLGFNVVILPKSQDLGDWYAESFATNYMPEEYVTRLANSGIMSVRHFLPSLQQTTKWEERKKTIILVGTRGEVPNLHKSPKKPLVQPVPAGTIVLGHELHQSLGLKPGDKVVLKGREFTVHRCHPERGNRDDITAWISLAEAQEIFDKKGLINAILALDCICIGEGSLARIRADIAGILPETRVIERGSKVIARAEARMKATATGRALLEQERRDRARLREAREQFAAVLVPVVMIACGAWVALLGFGNVRARRSEIGILRAVGLRSRQIMILFLSRSLIVGVIGGALGFLAGAFAGSRLGVALEGEAMTKAAPAGVLDPGLLLLAVVIASALTVIAGWIPATLAARQDPAVVLREG